MGRFREITPNLLSISRIPASAVFVWSYSESSAAFYYFSIAIVGLAVVTDFLDGFLARRWKVTSTAGYYLDGLGDKCFTVAICLVISRDQPELILFSWALISREVILYVLRVIDDKREANLRKLRTISLAQALFIRIFFLVFFAHGYLNLHGAQLPSEGILYPLFGAAAVVSGYITIWFLVSSLTRKKL